MIVDMICVSLLSVLDTKGLNKDHMAWVQAVADRAACGLMAVEGSTLFSEENAKAVKKHFANVLECLSQGENAEPDPAEPDSPRDAAS